MTGSNDEPEPMTTLADGTVTYSAIVERVEKLLVDGYSVQVLDDAVSITPAIAGDCAEWLSIHAPAVVAILERAAAVRVQ